MVCCTASKYPVPTNVWFAEEQAGAIRVGSGDEYGGHAQNVGGQTGRNQFLDELTCWYHYLAAHVPALLGRRKLVFKVDRRGAGFNHGLHEFEGVERSSETGLRVGYDRREPVGVLETVRMADLIGAHECVVNRPHQRGDAVGGIQALVRVHLTGQVGVSRHLPAANVDRFQTGLDLLHRLVAR
jgi:hypothetical protein